jgi:hypothetical protein
MNDDEAARAVAVRVRVLFRWPPVCGPTRVPYAVRPVERGEANGFFKVAQLAFRATNLKVMPFVNDRYASRIVAAIFELSQPVNYYGHDLLIADVSNNATHKKVPLSLKLERQLPSARC